MKKLILLLWLIPTLLYAQSNGANKGTNTQNWNTLTKERFTIQYPEDWEVDKNGSYGTFFILYSPLASSEDKFKENINFIIQDVSAYNFDLNQYTNISIEQIKTMMTNSTIIENKRLKKGDDEYQKLIYTATQGQFQLKIEQYYFIVNQKALVLTLTCEEKVFEQYKEIGEKILNSFQFK